MIELVIPGRPVPKGRPRLGASGVYTPRATRDAEDRIAWACRAKRIRLGARPVRITIDFYGAHWAADVDNLVKLVLDGLQAGGAIANDRQVVKLSADQHPEPGYGGPHTVIRIEALDEAA